MTSVEPPLTQPEQDQDQDQDFGFLDLLTMLGEEKWTVLAVTFIGTVIGVVMSLVATPIFTSTAVIMPAQQGGGGSAAGALAQLAQVPGLGAFGGIAGGKSSDQLYVALMRSQTIQDTLIKKHDLRKKWGSRSIEDARLSLSTAVSIGTDKLSGLINISAKDPDPAFAADLANSHIEELHKMLERVHPPDELSNAFYGTSFV
jgi:capsular polysaccharide biosynthesis protein